MNQSLQNNATSIAIEKLVIGGDLAALTPQQRVNYYLGLCQSLKLNPAQKPFEYIKLNNKLVLYALKGATDQLRAMHNVSIHKLEEREENELLIVTAYARCGEREDCDQGAVSLKGLQGEARANARMKCITKAKRRVTLSICGLGMLDETEISSIPSARDTGANNWLCLPDTAQEMIRVCGELVQQGVAQAELVKRLPAGKASRQRLTEAEAQLFQSGLS